ncbi:MAG: threonylcarbamoyl-AMP synthase [Nocardioidaceae bacterium]|nr:threonylcarbamoyl-AMP synthase [Nocardioidaceae bacterium]
MNASAGQRFDCTLGDEECDRGIEAAVSALGAGGLVVLPTDTVYGLAADAFDPAAVQRLLRAKGRGADKPPPVLVAAETTLDALAIRVPVIARELVSELWPGPLTLICHQQPSLTWDLGDTRGTVAIRMPDARLTLDVIKLTGPLAVTSANRTGMPPAVSVSEAREMLGSAVDVYLDEGPKITALASTILDVTRDPPRVVRVGAVSLERLQAFAAGIELDSRDA